MSKWVNANTLLILMLTCIGTAMIASSAFMRWPDLPTLLLGRDKGLIEQFGGLLATALLIVGAAYTARTFRLSQQQAQLSQRQAEGATYEKGAELLAHDKSSANINGKYIMNSAASRRPERFWQPAVLAISAYLGDVSKVRYQELMRFHTSNVRPPVAERPELPAFADTPYTALAALAGLSNLRQTEKEWPASADHGERRIEAQSFVLEYCRLTRLHLDRTILSNVVIGAVTLEQCVLDDSDIHLIVYRGIQFDAKCTMQNTKFRIFDAWGFRLGEPEFSAQVVFEAGCDFSTATIFDKPVSDVVVAAH